MGGLNAPWLDNTMIRSTRLQDPTLSRLRLDSHFTRWTPRRTPKAKPMVPRWTLPHSDTSHPLVSPPTQPLAVHIQNTSKTVPVVPTVPVVSTSVLQHEAPGLLLAHPHPPSHSPARTPAPCPHRLGQSSHLPRYAASYSCLKDETSDLRTWVVI